MKARSRLKHAAAGLLGSLLSRNNDVNGYWGPSLLYRDANASHDLMELDLLTGQSQPDSEAAKLVAARYTTFLCDALKKLEFEWNGLTCATAKFQFNAEIPDPHYRYECQGGGRQASCRLNL